MPERPHDTIRLAFDGRLLEGALVAESIELTMTSYTAPELDSLMRELGRAAKRRGEVIAVELAPESLRSLLGSLYAVHAELAAAPLAIAITWCGVDIRTNSHLGEGRFMPIFRCGPCEGRGRVHRAAVGREEPCTACRGSGECRGF